jgi:hypothetical protein
MGVQEASSDDGTSTPASYHAIADVKEEIADLAYSFMEQALAYMETEKAYFTDWAGSDSYTEIKSCFVWNTAIFNKHVNAGGSRHTFLAVRSQLIGVQEDVVYSQLGEAFYEDLLAKLKANTLSAAETKAVEKIQAWQSVAGLLRAVPMHRMKLIDGGIQIRSHLDGPERTLSAPVDAVKELKALLTSQAASYKTRLIEYLDTNASLFPDYIASDYELGDGKPTRRLLDNRYKKSFRA